MCQESGRLVLQKGGKGSSLYIFGGELDVQSTCEVEVDTLHLEKCATVLVSRLAADILSLNNCKDCTVTSASVGLLVLNCSDLKVMKSLATTHIVRNDGSLLLDNPNTKLTGEACDVFDTDGFDRTLAVSRVWEEGDRNCLSCKKLPIPANGFELQCLNSSEWFYKIPPSLTCYGVVMFFSCDGCCARHEIDTWFSVKSRNHKNVVCKSVSRVSSGDYSLVVFPFTIKPECNGDDEFEFCFDGEHGPLIDAGRKVSCCFVFKR